MGKAVNPKIAEGQIEGGFGMCIGTTLYEDIILDEHGAPINTGFLDYRIPTTLDIPVCDNSKVLIVESIEPEGPFGAKGVGELPLVAGAPAITNAIYNAIGVRIKDLPISKEKVYESIKRLHKTL